MPEQSTVLQPTPGANLGGLVGHVRLLPAASVTSLAVADGAATGQILLAPQTVYCDIWFTPGSAQYTEESEQTDQGVLYKKKLVLQVHRDAPSAAASFARLAQVREFVALVQTHNGLSYILGSPEWPLRLATSLDTGRRLSDGSSRGLQLMADSPEPAAVYPYFSVAGSAQSTTEPGTGTTPGTGTGGTGTGTGSVSLAFNWNRPITAAVPGLQGKIAGGSTLAAGLENLLFEPLGPTAALNLSPTDFDFTPLAMVEVDVFYTATPRGASLEAVRLDNVALPLNAGGTGPTSGDTTKAVPANVNRVLQLTVRDEADKTASASAGITFWLRRFWFTSPDDLMALLLDDEEQAVSQAVRQAHAGERAQSRQQARTLQPAGEFCYFLWPAAWGSPSITVNGLPNNDFVERPFTFTTATGYEHQALLVRTGSKLNSTYQFTIS